MLRFNWYSSTKDEKRSLEPKQREGWMMVETNGTEDGANVVIE